ncbi:MAG: hypothetical protein R2681_13645 [Pyrinomonadaceae bacterium]
MIQKPQNICYRRVFHVIVLVAFALILLPEPVVDAADVLPKPAASSWKTKEFFIVWYSPNFTDGYEIGEWIRRSDPTPAERLRYIKLDKFLRESLTEIAGFYEANGINEPHLPLVKGSDGVERWKVYAYAFKEGFYVSDTEKHASGYYSNGNCNLLNSIFSRTTDFHPSDPELAFDIGHLLGDSPNAETDLAVLYSTAAHELFHAVQSAYDLKWSSTLQCKSRTGNGYHPLVEGTATAVEAFAIENKYPGWLSQFTLDHPELGAFPYHQFDFMTVGHPSEERESGRDPDLAYKTSSFWKYLADTYGGLRVFDTIFSSPITGNIEGSDPTLADRYRWLDKVVKKITLTAALQAGNASGEKGMYLVLPEFYAELASYPDSNFANYANIDFDNDDSDDWLSTIFIGLKGDCHSVELKGDTGSDEINLFKYSGLVPNGATCIEVKWSELSGPFKIEAEAAYADERTVDQIHLGVASLTFSGTNEFCIDWIDWAVKGSGLGGGRADFKCSFGKPLVKIYDETDGEEFVYRREWGMDWPNLKDKVFWEWLEPSGTAILILSNVNVEPGKTVKAGDQSPLKIQFSVRQKKSADGRKFEPPKYLDSSLPMNYSVPTNFSRPRYLLMPTVYTPGTGLIEGPDRYSFYGVVTGSRVLPFGQGLGFQTAPADDPEKVYYISPAVAEEFKYKQTGPFKAVVGMVTGPSSIYCNSEKDEAPNANIIRSDEFQLRFTVKTDICKYDAATKTARVVETMDAEFVLPFARRYFPKTAKGDTVTPGTEQYIDEFLRDAVLYGIPIPPDVRLSDGSYPANFSGGGGSDDENADGSGSSDGEVPASREVPKCNCTCKEYERITKVLEEAKKSNSKDPKILREIYCFQKCMPEFRSCYLK